MLTQLIPRNMRDLEALVSLCFNIHPQRQPPERYGLTLRLLSACVLASMQPCRDARARISAAETWGLRDVSATRWRESCMQPTSKFGGLSFACLTESGRSSTLQRIDVPYPFVRNFGKISNPPVSHAAKDPGKFPGSQRCDSSDYFDRGLSNCTGRKPVDCKVQS